MAISTPAPDPNAGGGSMSRMAGMDDPSSDPSMSDPMSGGAPNPEDMLRATIEQIRGMEETLRGLSQAFPQATASIRTAITGVQGVLKEIVANPGGIGSPESAPPNTEL